MTKPECIQELAGLFDLDHARLVGLLDDVRVLCAGGSFQSAAKVFGEFRMLQEHHLRSEDQALARLKSVGGCPPALLARVFAAHAQLEALMEVVWKAISGADHENLEGSITALIEAVSAHEREEKEALLPALAAGIGDATQFERTVRQLIDR